MAKAKPVTCTFCHETVIPVRKRGEAVGHFVGGILASIILAPAGAQGINKAIEKLVYKYCPKCGRTID